MPLFPVRTLHCRTRSHRGDTHLMSKREGRVGPDPLNEVVVRHHLPYETLRFLDLIFLGKPKVDRRLPLVHGAVGAPTVRLLRRAFWGSS